MQCFRGRTASPPYISERTTDAAYSRVQHRTTRFLDGSSSRSLASVFFNTAAPLFSRLDSQLMSFLISFFCHLLLFHFGCGPRWVGCACSSTRMWTYGGARLLLSKYRTSASVLALLLQPVVGYFGCRFVWHVGFSEIGVASKRTRGIVLFNSIRGRCCSDMCC